MKSDLSSVYNALQVIHAKHSRRYRGNSRSNQICCMWSTDDPPDIIEGTEPITDIEEAFGIEISDDEALELYDMNLDEATKRIIEIKNRNG